MDGPPRRGPPTSGRLMIVEMRTYTLGFGTTARYFELYRDHQLLDSGFFVFQTGLQFSFQGQRGRFDIEGDHLVIHEPVRYLNWTWRRGTGDYAGFTGSGKAQFIYPKPELYGVLGQLSGTIRNASTGAPSPSHH